MSSLYSYRKTLSVAFHGPSNYYEKNEKTREYATGDISVYNCSRKKDEDSLNNIQKFKLYGEDLNILREQIIKSESSYILSRSTPAIVSLLLIFLRFTVGIPSGEFLKLAVRFIEVILLLVLIIILMQIILTMLLLVPSLLESGKVLNRFGINEKEKKFYKLSQNYFEL